MKSSVSMTVAITLGAAGLVALAGPARAGGAAHQAHAARHAAAVAAVPAAAAVAAVPAAAAVAAVPAAAPQVDAPCGLDDLGFDQLLAKRTEPRGTAPRPQRPVVDTLARAEAAADAFELGPRNEVTRRPTVEGEVEMTPHTLTPAIVAPIVADRLGDLYYCFMRIPKAERVDETFILHLTIAPRGTVLDAGVAGGKHAARIQACVKAQARRWVFPQGDAPSEVDYPLSFSVAH
jgi:hypothetical protein